MTEPHAERAMELAYELEKAGILRWGKRKMVKIVWQALEGNPNAEGKMKYLITEVQRLPVVENVP